MARDMPTVTEQLGVVLVPHTGSLVLVGEVGEVSITLAAARGELSTATEMGMPTGTKGSSVAVLTAAAALLGALSGAVLSPASLGLATGTPPALSRVRPIDLGADVSVDGRAETLLAQHQTLVRELMVILRSQAS